MVSLINNIECIAENKPYHSNNTLFNGISTVKTYLLLALLVILEWFLQFWRVHPSVTFSAQVPSKQSETRCQRCHCMTDKHTQGFEKIKELKSIFGSYLTVAPLSVRVRGKIKGQIKDNTSQDLIISSCKRVLKVLPKSVLYLSQNCSKCTVAVSFYSFNCEASSGGTAGGPTLKFHEWVPTIGKKLFLLYIWCPENNWSTELSQSKTRERHCDWTQRGKRE